MKMKNNKKGFTLAELLIVVAIIAVLVAIAMPIFSAQLEKAREATDAANIRAAYAEVVANGISGEITDSKLKKSVSLKQQVTGWQNAFDFPANLQGHSTAEPAKDNTVTVEYVASTSSVEAHAACNIKLTSD